MAINWKDDLTDQLCGAFLAMGNKDEMYFFLEDIATIGEIKALSQRFEVAKLLSRGLTYPQIAQKTGASTATISRVKKCLEHGANGYNIAIERSVEKG
ncbi:MAG: YerC/YecD family TrpR-related protein [Synergistaceae bacterium]|nr:YerC/YecD family TrpR-related protein [Synergistaceae bacterium]